MTTPLLRAIRRWLVTAGFVLSVVAIVLALYLNRVQNEHTAENLHRAQVASCRAQRENRERTFATVEILRDLDAVDGRVSPVTNEFIARVHAEYRTLPACDALKKNG